MFLLLVIHAVLQREVVEGLGEYSCCFGVSSVPSGLHGAYTGDRALFRDCSTFDCGEWAGDDTVGDHDGRDGLDWGDDGFGIAEDGRVDELCGSLVGGCGGCRCILICSDFDVRYRVCGEDVGR